MALDSVEPGMFVCRIDRPWSETPFPLQGVLVAGRADVDALRPYTAEVVVDLQRSQRFDGGLLQRLCAIPKPGTSLPQLQVYPQPIPVEDELPHIRRAYGDALALAKRLQSDLEQGRPLDLEQLSVSVEPVVASVLRSPDAYFWLTSLRKRDPYAYGHALNCAALSAALGRQIGLPSDLLVELAGSALLMDMGMSRLPDGLCNHGLLLSAGQRRQMQTHVELGLELLSERAGISADQLEWIRHHHERHDGSGYPRGVLSSEIPLFGRMLGVVDTFDALCTDRAHQRAVSRHDAIQALYRERDRLFQSELIEQFGLALGVYPTGSLVELSSGEVAVVTQQNAARRLFPRVTLLTCADKTLDPSFSQIDLWLDSGPSGERRTILRGLRSGAFGLDLAQLFLA